jgi:hypothetical protein
VQLAAAAWAPIAFTDIAAARVALRDWPAVRDCRLIGMRAGDRSGVVSKPCEVAGGGDVPAVGPVEAGAVEPGTITARPARTAPKAARRVREIEWAPTRARYAGA